MNISVYHIVQYLLLLIAIIFLARFIWYHFKDRRHQPVSWQEAVKNGRVTADLFRLKKSLYDATRFFNWWLQVERLRNEKIQGDFAELGVYKGVSAKILHAMDNSRLFHLFDTFSGFSSEDLKSETGEAATYTSLSFSDTDPGSVLRYIGGNGNIRIYPGTFPATADSLKENTFSLVNIDADLYNPTRAGLEFFYPRMTPGGVIMIHDYNYKWPGVIKAVDEFTAGIPEVPVLIPDIDGTIMIIRNK